MPFLADPKAVRELRRGVLAETNAQQVEKIVRILGEPALEIATPDETRRMLGLKGPDRTAIPASA